MTVFLLLILGTSLGSFLANYTYRIPRNISISKGRSRCDKCEVEIVWYDNIPVVSYLLLNGKCRNCNKKISARYPLIEITTALGFLAIYLLLSNCSVNSPLCSWQQMLGAFTLPFFLFVYSVLLAIFVIDWEHKIIPDELVFVLFLTILIIFLFFFPQLLYINMLIGLLSATFLLLLNLLTFGKGMGLGDVKFALVAGMLIGFPGVFVWMFLSFLIGAVIGVLLIVFGKAKFGRQIAFGPFLVIGLVLAMIIPATYAIFF